MVKNLDWRPTIVTPEETDAETGATDLVEYLRNQDGIDEKLICGKALLFRGFDISKQNLDDAFDALLPHRIAYLHGNTPRSKVGQNLYTSTEYPPEYTIFLHNELSYTHTWPARVAFYCDVPAESGGATPVVDGERWLSSLSDEIRTAFARGIRYTQNLHGGRGFGKSWQTTFETDDRDQVDGFLSRDGVQWEWKEDGGLRISQIRPATVTHPITGVEVWFNQADQWHPAAGLDTDTAAALSAILPEDEFPQTVSFADGSPIPSEWAIKIRDCGLEAAIDVDWQVGDLLLIDNILVGHGRRPFSGRRRILVAMSG